MAFKMKGSTHYGKNPLKQVYDLNTQIGRQLDKKDTIIRGPHRPKRDGSQDLKPIMKDKLVTGNYKPKPSDKIKPMSALKFDDTVKGKSKKVAKHPLYDKLPNWAKTAYNKLSEKERANVNKNKSESQLLNSLGNYTPKFEGGD